MGTKKIGVGVIGGGKAGRNLARAISADPLGEVVMFCTRHRETARAAAAECAGSRWTTDYGSLLGDPAIEAVVVASPDECHYRHVIMACAAGKHVLCEKPMCRTLGEADRMTAEAEARGIVFMVGFTERFNHQCLEARKMIDAGLVGIPRMITARRCHSRAAVRGRNWLNDAATGGVLNYVGTHNIDLACWFMGASPERVYAETGQLVLKE